ncbi:hypothetical protein BX616_007749 [Lobosporangium transversale]|uniref:Uncharacterized protein n=1 Tax=Lobosporangium transversale TaxID=64571 RepID=A0A1Y2GN13_9FUNG|nr:hypothetical protein BCR41DRAFT_422362 [Lobosporangium transversale]KAF9914700.1 hypothetical protein BX616_007749 [Lobosporangium transversale]ORZ14840.1 hypothetical protein BCR41DRAFT_422362 [Lobosporangium transversale]|eukprot:XP_021880972.1 hypothetical protein BCR41DRAFT_422362 [Lobosporangium transversale]
MGAVGIQRLRILILLLTITAFTLACVCFSECYRNLDEGGAPVTLSVVIFFSYSYSLKGKPIVGRSVRAFCIFVLSALTVVSCLALDPTNSRSNADYFGYPLLVPGFFMLIDMGWTLWDTRPKQPNGSQESKESPDIIIISPEIPHRNGTAVSPTQYVYPPLPQHLQSQPQELMPNTHYFAVDPPPLEVKGGPQPHPEEASPHLLQNREVPQLSRSPQPTALPSSQAPQLLPQAPQLYGTLQSQPEMVTPHLLQDRVMSQHFQPQTSQPTKLLSPQAPQLLPQAPQFYEILQPQPEMTFSYLQQGQGMQRSPQFYETS